MSNLQLANRDSGQLLVQDLRVADGFFSRFIGLQFRKQLAPGAGLLLIPCSSVHTFCMRFAIDVIGVGRDGKVLAIKRNLKPWRVAVLPFSVYGVVEVPAGGSSPVREGDYLQLHGAGGRRSLQFLRNDPRLTT